MKIRLKGDEKLQVVDYRKKQQTRATEIRYGLELPIVLEFYHDNDAAFAEEELSIYTSFQFAIDADFDFTTNPPVLANNDTTTFVISGNTISFTVMTDTAGLKTLIGNNPTAKAYAEFKAYKPGKTRPAKAPVFEVMIYNAVAADGSEEPSASPELYITTAEAYALVQSTPDREFSVDGATLWHTPQLDADRYYRERRNGGEWAEVVALVPGADGQSFTVDATGLLSSKSSYDAELKSFAFLATDTGDLYLKNSDTSGDWSSAIPFRGPAFVYEDFTPEQIAALKGADFTYEDFTPEQVAALKGAAFVYEDFTPEQIAALKGADFTYEDFTPEQVAALKGAAFVYEDFTPEQITALKGAAFVFEDFTPEQIATLKGVDGTSFKVDETGLFSTKTSYDAELKGFAFLATDTGDLYLKNSDTSGDWSSAIPFRGPAFAYEDFTPEQIAALKGAAFVYEDFTPEQIAALKGAAFVFEDFTPEQIAALKGTNAPQVQIEFSINGSTLWHSTFATGDLFQRISVDGGTNWTDAIKFVGDDGAITNLSKAATELTITSGVITKIQLAHKIDGESDADDDLVTINGGTNGDFLVVFPENSARNITIKHGTGNIITGDGEDFTIPDDGMVWLYYDGTNWRITAGASTSSSGGGADWFAEWSANSFPQDINTTTWSNITAYPASNYDDYNYPVFDVDYATPEGLGLFLIEIPTNTNNLVTKILAQPLVSGATGDNMHWNMDFCIYRAGSAEGTITTIDLGATAFNATGQTETNISKALSALTDETLTAQAGDTLAIVIYPKTTSATSSKQTDWQVMKIRFEVS